MSVESQCPSRQTVQGMLLRRARLAAELTQKEAAQAIGISPRALSRCERGKQTLSLPHLELLSRIYGTPISSFWAEPMEPEDPASIRALDYVALRRKMIGVLLRQMRLTRGKTLGDFAEALGTSPERMAAIEFGETDIPFSDLEKLADLCDMPMAHFADPSLMSSSLHPDAGLGEFSHLPGEVREFVAQPANVLYLRVAMLLSELSAETLRRVGEALLDITL